MSKVNRPLLIAIAYCSLFTFGLIDNIRGPFLPEVNSDLSLTGTTSSLYFAAASLFAFLGSVTGPIFLQKNSSVKLLMWSSVLLAFSFAAVSQAQSFLVLILSSCALGYAFGGLNLSQNILISDVSLPVSRRRLFSGLHSMYGLSALAAPVTATVLRWLGLDWRQSFLILTVGPLIMAAIAFFSRNSVHAHANEPKTAKLNSSEIKSVLWLAFIMACYLFGEISASSRMVLWLRTERGFLPDMANLYLAGFFILLLLGRLVFTFWHFSWRSELVLKVSAFLSAILYGLGLVHSPLWLVLSGMTMAPFFPVAMDYIAHQFGRKSSAALSLILGLGSLSVVGMHTCLGLISDWQNLTYALGIGPMGLAFIALSFSSQAVTKK